MKLTRREFLHVAVGVIAFPTLSRGTVAPDYPTRPVRIIAGFSAGSTTDIIARLIGQWLQDRLGQPFVIENRPGAGGTIGTEAVVHASPDGYTLLLVSSAHAINATLYNNLSFNLISDITPIAAIVSVPNVAVINPSVSARTVPELIAYAKANPGKLNMASAGNGTSSHLAGELFKIMAGVNLVHIPYRGSPPALTDLLGGQVEIYFAPMPPSIEYIRAGKLRALGVTGVVRSEALPDVPTVGEFVPGYEASTWAGIGAPRNTSAQIVDELNREINAVFTDPKMKARFDELGGTAIGGSPADFGRFIAAEIEKWGKVIRAANIKPG
jgi:tripartite-type tricarboxylate transporter receptor subunit TctC